MRRKRFWPILIILVLAYSGWAILRPLPELKPTKSNFTIQVPTAKANITWPSSQASLGILNSNIESSNGDNAVVPTASTAKIITSLVILDKKPLKPGETGPLITITAEEANRYNTYLAQNGSVLPLNTGTQISQHQALQAILLPSANNVSDTLAVWVFGSLEAYKTAANAYLKKNGFKVTQVGSDASGLSPDTVSNSAEMVKIGMLAMANPVISQIVAQSEVTGIPQVNKITNTNYLLGADGIVGIKTGHSDQAGGAFIGAAKFKVNGQDKTVVTAIMKSTDRARAMSESLALIKSAQANFKPTQLIKKGAVITEYKQPWGGTIKAVVEKDLTLAVWQGTPATLRGSIKNISSETATGASVGTISYEGKQVEIKTSSHASSPSIWWRLTNPIGG